MHDSHERHRRYRMSCDQFDEVIARNNERCEICDVPAKETWRKKLVIDHEYDKGTWAVRGLLCPPCNTSLGPGRAFNDRAAAYLANPWWVPMVAAAGFPGGHRAEPRNGTVVSDPIRGQWQRDGTVWVPVKGYYKTPMSWLLLIQMFGPHLIKERP